MADTRLQSLIDYARRFVGDPYVYGGDGAGVFDCSGLACAILRKAGIVRVSEDLNAQALYHRLMERGRSFKIGDRGEMLEEQKGRFFFPAGTWFFYGTSLDSITHVSFMVDSYSILEAGGGDSTTKTEDDAKKRRAFVREVFHPHRKDIVAAVLPKYGWEP